MRRFATNLFAASLTLGISNARAAEVPGNWVDVAAGSMFTVKAPPGTTFERTRIGDAFSGIIHGAGFELVIEFGYHRDEIQSPNGAQNSKVEKVVIDEKPGSIIMASVADPAHPYYVGLHVPAVENDIIGNLSLVVNGQLVKAEDQATVHQIYETMKFGYKN